MDKTQLALNELRNLILDNAALNYVPVKEETMNSIDELLTQINNLTKDVGAQAELLNHNLQRIQTSIKVLNYQLGILGHREESDVH